MDFESNYDIDRTANFIHTRNFTRVALQFPDELLKDATRVVRAIREKLKNIRECGRAGGVGGDDGKDAGGRDGNGEVGLYVMADTTYGNCCVDEVGAAHVDADLVVHYGHTCLSPTSTLPAFFVFGKSGIDVMNCATKIAHFALTHGKPILVLFGLEYAYAIRDIKEALKVQKYEWQRSTSSSNIVWANASCSMIDPVKGRVNSDGILRVTGNNVTNEACDLGAWRTYSIGGLTWSFPTGHNVEDYLLFWIGPDNAAFTNVVLRFNACEIIRYDAPADHLVTDVSQQRRILKRRYFLVEKAKDANMVGILVGTLAVAGYLHMIHQMKELVTKAGKKAYTLVMGKPNPAKLANFPECDVFVYVSCEQTVLFDSKEFLAPVITPYEAMLAFSSGSQWTGAYTMEFRDLIGSSFDSQDNSNEARFSFFQGGYVEEHDHKEDGEEKEESVALAVAAEKALQVRDKSPHLLVKGTARSGAEYLVARSYQGLDIYNEDSEPGPFLIGRTGKASGYQDEKLRQEPAEIS